MDANIKDTISHYMVLALFLILSWLMYSHFKDNERLKWWLTFLFPIVVTVIIAYVSLCYVVAQLAPISLEIDQVEQTANGTIAGRISNKSTVDLVLMSSHGRLRSDVVLIGYSDAKQAVFLHDVYHLKDSERGNCLISAKPTVNYPIGINLAYTADFMNPAYGSEYKKTYKYTSGLNTEINVHHQSSMFILAPNGEGHFYINGVLGIEKKLNKESTEDLVYMVMAIPQKVRRVNISGFLNNAISRLLLADDERYFVFEYARHKWNAIGDLTQQEYKQYVASIRCEETQTSSRWVQDENGYSREPFEGTILRQYLPK